MAEKETPQIVETENLEQIEEGSAADTLKPGAGSAGAGDSKSQTLAAFTALAAQLGKEDLSKFFNDMQAMFGPNKTPGGAEDKSGANKATIKAKPSAAKGSGEGAVANPPQGPGALSVKEDIDEMFGADDLSEEFKERAEVVFEAALNTRVILETARLEEEFEAMAAELEESFNEKLEEATASMFEELSGKIDQYLDYVVEQWMEENQVAVEAQLRTEIAEDFMAGLQNLFAEHYITIPEEKVDVFGELKAEVEDLKSKLNEALDEKIALETIVNEATKEALLDEVTEGLVVTQAEKLRTLAEGIEYSDADTFKKKLEIVKEQYFSEKKPAASTGLITEEIDGVDESVNESTIPAGMAKYVEAISKTIK